MIERNVEYTRCIWYRNHIYFQLPCHLISVFSSVHICPILVDKYFDQFQCHLHSPFHVTLSGYEGTPTCLQFTVDDCLFFANNYRPFRKPHPGVSSLTRRTLSIRVLWTVKWNDINESRRIGYLFPQGVRFSLWRSQTTFYSAIQPLCLVRGIVR